MADRHRAPHAFSIRGILLQCLCILPLVACTTIEVTEKTLFHPDEGPPPVQDLGAGYRMDTVAVAHADGAVSEGIYLSHLGASATILYFGGNGFHIDRASRDLITALAKASVDIVIFDYRGYGRSKGTPTGALLMTDAADELRFVKARAKGPVVVYGHSMGTVFAGTLAADNTVDGVVLEGGFRSVPGLIESHIPWYSKPFVTVHYQPSLLQVDTVRSLSGYTGALLVVAGEDDPVVPVRQQQAVFAGAATANKQIQVFPGFGHEGLVTSDAFPAVLADFLAHRVTVGWRAVAGHAEPGG